MNTAVPNSPITIRRQEANEKNAQLSTGPRTAAGIEACKHNRLSHGLASSMTVLPCEDQAQFDELLAAFSAEHSPATTTEHVLVTQIAAAVWKLRRLGAIEERVFERMLAGGSADVTPFDQMALELTGDSGAGRALNLLARYQSTLNRQFLQALKELRILQDRRRAAQAQSDKLETLHQLAGNTERTHSQKRSLELFTTDADILVNYVNAEALVLAGAPLKSLVKARIAA